MALTTNYNLYKNSIGHQMLDVDIDTNMDLLDAAMKMPDDRITALEQPV